MKKIVSLLLIVMLAMTSASALAGAYDPDYTMAAEGTVLQDVADRNITPAAGALDINPVIEGESPVTGLPLAEGRYMPVLVQISNPEGLVKIDGKNVTAAGIGEHAPWGGQYADIVYEGILYRTGQTRITFLFSDSLVDGLPTSAGPVRSARIGHVLLREEWQGGIAFAGGPRRPGNNIFDTFKELGATEKGVVFNLLNNGYESVSNRVSGLHGADNLNVNPAGIQAMIPETTVAEPHPFLFADLCPYLEGYELAYTINLDWGHSKYISHFYYDETTNLYLRYSGAAPYMTSASSEDRSEENQEQMAFSNVIIQRVGYDYANGNSTMPLMRAVGQGNADIFIGGRYIPGYWVRESETSPTVFLDDQGNELVLTRGTTFIAHFPPESLLTFSGL